MGAPGPGGTRADELGGDTVTELSTFLFGSSSVADGALMLGGMLDDVLRHQHGVITAQQALVCGLSREAIRARLRSGRWRRLFPDSRPSVYAAFSGPLPRSSQLWAAVLRAGEGAALSHLTAAELDGLLRPGEAHHEAIHVTVPSDRRVRLSPGSSLLKVSLHRSSRLAVAVHPARLPPRTRVEETILDLAQSAHHLEEAVVWLARGVQHQLTTPQRLLTALSQRARARWRHEMREALGDIDAGAQTILEIRFLRDVENAHRLPACVRQAKAIRAGKINYDDARNQTYGVIIELDGGVAHPVGSRARDRSRDNDSTSRGDVVVRYGWSDITETPCATALQLATIYHRRGWQGTPQPCVRPECALRAQAAA